MYYLYGALAIMRKIKSKFDVLAHTSYDWDFIAYLY
jgi:hypothetical protein